MGGVELPQQLSLLYGGKIAPHFGAFGQVTYDFSADTFNIDNNDFRFANAIVLPDKKPFTYGVSINNNPTIEDPWNTTPLIGNARCKSAVVYRPNGSGAAEKATKSWPSASKSERSFDQSSQTNTDSTPCRRHPAFRGWSA